MKKGYKFIHFLRGIATLSVIICHYFILFFVNNEVASSLGMFNKIEFDYVPFWISKLNIIGLFDFGKFGVCIFFLFLDF